MPATSMTDPTTGPMTARVTHPRVPPRRGAARAGRWWGKAWVRAVEEAAYAEADLRAARALARSGGIGQIAVEPGGFVATVVVHDDAWTVAGTLPVLDESALEALVETVAAEAGRIGALLGGDLPHTLVEHAEEAGVELLPFGAELGSTCTCEAWVDPCPHALAVLYQLTWLIESDPLVLLHLRGLPREALLARLHDRVQAESAHPRETAESAPVHAAEPAHPGETADLDLDVGYEAALRAARFLELLDSDGSVDHLV